MKTEIRNCKQCKADFTIEPDDFTFYEKIGVLPPTLCPQCRAQRRLAFRNERSFYKRPCDKCKRDIVSMYSPNKPYTVWCHDCWFSDDWSPLDYGKEYEADRPFFDQFKEVWEKVPKISLIHVRSINSEYLNISADNKNCYMIVESSNNEDSIHCYWIQKTRSCVDTSFSHECERCYESDDVYNCYQVLYSKGCHDCRDSYFLFDCRNCSNCIGCTNLRNKQYCVFNKQVSREEYEKFLRDAKLDTYSGVEALRIQFEEFKRSQPHRYAEIVNASECTGTYIKNAKNCSNCFHAYDAEDCRYAVHAWRDAKDCMDTDTTGRNAHMMYNSTNSGLVGSNYVCCSLCWGNSFLQYCVYCYDCQDCFGSSGLRKKQYCVLNKQYSKEEYNKLKNQIIKDMKKDEIYGEFFHPSLSTFGYNEACVYEQFPLLKDEALKQGFKWEDYPRGTYGKETKSLNQVSDSIQDISFDVTREVFICQKCSKNYKIILAEFQFYKSLNIPLPRLCPDCRHLRRFKARGPNRLWKRICQCLSAEALAKADAYKNTVSHSHGEKPCSNEFETNYPPRTTPSRAGAQDRPEIVYCGDCYNDEII